MDHIVIQTLSTQNKTGLWAIQNLTAAALDKDQAVAAELLQLEVVGGADAARLRVLVVVGTGNRFARLLGLLLNRVAEDGVGALAVRLLALVTGLEDGRLLGAAVELAVLLVAVRVACLLYTSPSPRDS